MFQVTSTPAAHDVELVVRAWPFLTPPRVTAQPMELWVNGRAVGRGELVEGGTKDVALRIPAEVWNLRPVVTFVMQLPNSSSPREPGISDDDRHFGWAVEGLTFRYADR